MSRKVFDILTSTAGVVVVVVLVVAGGLLTLGPQLREHQRPQPARAAADLLPAAGGVRAPQDRHRDHARMIPSVSQYAGQELLTGAQAEVYADHFIAVHLSEMPYGGVYSKISAAAIASPKNRKLAA